MLLQLHQVSVQQGQRVLFENLDFTWSEGENWAIIGEKGQELTDFLQLLLGNRSVVSGNVTRPFAQGYIEEKSRLGEVNSFRDLIAYVGQDYPFRNKSNLQNFYYQQRFNSMDSEDTVSVIDYLKESPKRVGKWTLASVVKLLDLEYLQEESLIKLSNGESRRLAIAVALMQQPKLLLMDQPMTGLDIQTRESFNEILLTIVNEGVHLMMNTIPSEIPEVITHLGEIKQKKINQVLRSQLVLEGQASQSVESYFDKKLLTTLIQTNNQAGFQNLVRLENVSIKYRNKLILKDLSWEIKPHERWQLKGPNGAGKSTLISLLIGEHPQSYSNNIILFDRKRGTGESIWDIKRHVGFVAPELIRFFPKNQTVWKILLSGFFDTMGLFKKPNLEQERLAKTWIKLLRLETKENHLLHQLTLPEQRFLLVARALIKRPALLIIDEGAQGLDITNRLIFKIFLEQVLNESTIATIYVSHYQEDIPRGVSRVFELKKPL